MRDRLIHRVDVRGVELTDATHAHIDRTTMDASPRSGRPRLGGGPDPTPLEATLGMRHALVVATRLLLVLTRLRLGDHVAARETLARTPEPEWDWVETRAASAAVHLAGDGRAAEADVERALELLSKAELRVLRYLPSNLSAPEIGRELYLSLGTVKTHMRHIYTKLGVHRRTEAVERAPRTRLALALLAASVAGIG